MSQIAEFHAAVIRNLPELSGEAMQACIQEPMGLQERLRSVFLDLTPQWQIRDGLIYFEVEENGWSGLEWITWYDQNRYPLGDEAKFLLRSPAFQPGPNGTIYRVAVMPGGLWTDEKRTTANVRAKANELGFQHGQAMPPSLSCLIRQKFTNAQIKQMGKAVGQVLYWIIGLHEPINDSCGYPSPLGADANDPEPWLNAYDGKPSDRWTRELGFACVASQVGSKASES